MSTAVRCRLCAFDGVRVAIELMDMPRFNHRLLQRHELMDDRGITLVAHDCPSCGFVSVPVNLAEDYYADYVNVPSLSRQAQLFQKEEAFAFVRRFGLSGRAVLEVGCGDGYFLRAMQEAGAICHGVEPSSAQRALACSRGLEVEGGVLSNRRLLAAGPFAAFVTRQVFEHVEDMRDFLLTIRDNLAEGAVGLVEVPNLDKLIAEGRFFDFIPEHVNYFRPHSLGIALRQAGFDVLDISPVQEGESLRALVHWQAMPSYAPIAARVETLRHDVHRYVARSVEQGRKVAIWGAGGKGLSMLAAIKPHQVSLIVDGDPGKVGLFTPVSHLCVSAPKEIISAGIDAVIVMAPAYEREIANQLRSELGFSGEIMLAGSGLRRFD